MAYTLSRIDRKTRTYDLSAATLEAAAAIPPGVVGVDVALVPKRTGPTASTVWVAATYADGTFSVLLAGPDANPAGALVVPYDSDLWMRISDAPEVDAELVERITVLGGGVAAVAPVGETALTQATGDVRYAQLTPTADALALRPTQTAADARYVLDADLDAQVAPLVPDTGTATGAALAAKFALIGSGGGGGGGDVGYAADLTALRGLTPGTSEPVQILPGVGSYLYDAAATGADNGTTVIAPTSGTGRWLRRDLPAETEPGSIGWVLTQARTRTVRILCAGTSIAAGDNSVPLTTAEWLRTVYGDAGETDIMAGSAGGSFEAAFLGWSKQPYGGLGFVRARGSSTSSNWTSSVYGDRIAVEVSQESDGVQTNVLIDGVLAGTVTSAGAQKYGVRTEFTTTLGMHVVTIEKPATGHVYLERIRGRRSEATGIAIINATLGGSALRDMSTLRSPTGAQVAGIAIGTNVGVDAYYDRDDIDINLSSYVVNDSGANTTGLAGFTGTYTPSLARAVERTRIRNTQLVELVEMPGHYALPTTGADNWRTFQAIRDLLILTGKQNNHVLTVDWHGATILADLNLYASRYYGVTDLNLGTGVYTGDFIHPNEQGTSRGVAMLCQALGVDPPPSGKTSGIRNRRLADLGGELARTHKTLTVDGVQRRQTTAHGYALQIAAGSGSNGQPRVPYYIDHGVFDESGMRAIIDAAATSDQWGAYKDHTNVGVDALPNRTGVAGDWYTVTILATGVLNITTNGRIRINGVMLPDGAPTSIGFDPNTAVAGPIAYTFEWSPKGNDITERNIQVMNGRLYEFSVIRGGGLPIISHKTRVNAFLGPGPEQRLDNDPAFNSDYLGQRYFEDSSGTLLRKKLVSSGIKWDFSTQAPSATPVGVYESMDRTTANYRLARQFGTPTQSASPYLGGGGEQAASNSGILIGAAFPINVTGKASALIGLGAVSGVAGVRICFQNGGTFRFLTPAGAWSSSSQVVWNAVTYPMTRGQNYCFTFDLPTGADLTALGNTPDFRVEWQGMQANQPQSSATIVRGNSACI